MANTVKKLEYLDFPDCTQEALLFLVKTLSDHQGLPGRGGSAEALAAQVAQEYILDILKKRGHKSKKLNSIHELQLLELVCTTLKDAPEHARYNIFSTIFGGHVDPTKIALMTKLVSLAISTSCAQVLGCVALWMQEQGSQSQCVCDVAQRLVDDFCLLYPDIITSFRNLPSVSTLFTCNFITALTTIYTYTDASKTPPVELLECIVDWISADACLCSDSVRLVRIRSNFTCPLGGLLRWCILGPLVTSFGSNFSNLSSSSISSEQPSKSSSGEKLLSLFSKLHLGALVSLQAYKSMELNEHLFSYPDIYVVSKTLATYYRNGQCGKSVQEVINVSVDRLAQIIQVAINTRSLPEEVDLRQVFEGLPPNREASIYPYNSERQARDTLVHRLLQMILVAKYGRQPEAMDFS